MKETKVISLQERAQDEGKSYLEELLREGARKLLQEAIENEVASLAKSDRITVLLHRSCEARWV